ncbi:Zinc finger protein 36, C3H1 type-like 1, partial [Stegodyphus mimosarum]
MTLMCIDRSQSPTHKGNFLQGGKSPVTNINQNANHHRRNSCSPPLSKTQQDVSSAIKSLSNLDARKLERSASEPAADKRVVQSNSSRYKTELCRPFEENGTCKYGDKCQFAHGAKELRSMARHPKYKTELCRTFHSTGLCPYGPRCHFIHNSEETKKNLLTNLTGSVSPTPPITRPKPLTSLGSAGDLSPVSSHGGTPTGMKSFEDLYHQSPLSPGLSNGLSFTQDFTNLVNSLRFHDFPAREYNSDVYDSSVNVFNEGLMSVPDISVDNYNFQGNPVFDLIQTAVPLTPITPIDSNASFFRLPIFDLIHKQ